MTDIDREIAELEAQMNETYFWDNKEKAQEVIKKIKDKKRCYPNGMF